MLWSARRLGSIEEPILVGEIAREGRDRVQGCLSPWREGQVWPMAVGSTDASKVEWDLSGYGYERGSGSTTKSHNL